MVIQIIHLLVSIALVVLILIQAKGAGFGGILSGGSNSSHPQKGIDKILFWATLILAVLFLAGAVINSIVIGQK